MLAGLNITNLAILGQSILSQATSVFGVLNIPNLKMWVKSNVGVSVTGVNKISGWMDQSTGALNAVQQDPTLQPIYVATNSLGFPELVFDGVDDLLSAPSMQPFDVGFDYSGAGTYGGFLSITRTGGDINAGFFRNRFGANNYGTILNGSIRDEVPVQEMTILGGAYRNTFFNNISGKTYVGVINAMDTVNATSSAIFYQPSGNKTFYQKLQSTAVSSTFDNQTWQSTDLGTAGNYQFSVMEFYASLGAVTTGQVNQLSQGFVTMWLTGMKNFVLYLGDSLTYGYNLSVDSDTYPFKSAATLNIDYANAGVVGITAATITGNPPYYSSLVRPNRKNICVLWIGINDINSERQPYTDVAAIGTGLRAQGYKVVACTLPPADFSIFGTGAASHEANRVLLNGLIRTGYLTFADGIADIAADPVFISTGSWQNTNYYLDGLHLTASGYAVVSGVVNPVISGLLI